MATPESHETFRFRDFELDVAAYELRRDGHPVRLERQPMDLLILLVTRRGELVTRDEIIAKARDLVTPVLGSDACRRLIEAVFALETVKNIRDLRPMLQRA